MEKTAVSDASLHFGIAANVLDLLRAADAWKSIIKECSTLDVFRARKLAGTLATETQDVSFASLPTELIERIEQALRHLAFEETPDQFVNNHEWMVEGFLDRVSNALDRKIAEREGLSNVQIALIRFTTMSKMEDRTSNVRLWPKGLWNMHNEDECDGCAQMMECGEFCPRSRAVHDLLKTYGLVLPSVRFLNSVHLNDPLENYVKGVCMISIPTHTIGKHIGTDTMSRITTKNDDLRSIGVTHLSSSIFAKAEQSSHLFAKLLSEWDIACDTVNGNFSGCSAEEAEEFKKLAKKTCAEPKWMLVQECREDFQ